MMDNANLPHNDLFFFNIDQCMKICKVENVKYIEYNYVNLGVLQQLQGRKTKS